MDVVCAEGRVRVEGVLFRAGQAVTDMYVRSRGSCKGRGVLNNADLKKKANINFNLLRFDCLINVF